MSAPDQPTVEDLERLHKEIQAETNLFTRACGWYVYWSLHQIVYADKWKAVAQILKPGSLGPNKLGRNGW